MIVIIMWYVGLHDCKIDLSCHIIDVSATYHVSRLLSPWLSWHIVLNESMCPEKGSLKAPVELGDIC